jgi:hypothetical protein
LRAAAALSDGGGTQAVLLEKRVSRTKRSVPSFKIDISNKKREPEPDEGNFYFSAARNCVKFYLNNGRQNTTAPKYRSFEMFLSLPLAQARKTNVWRWYFRTGGHPPYDPGKRY